MASGDGYHLEDDVTCGVTEDGDKVTLMYTIGKKNKNVSWEWVQTDRGHVARMIARDRKGKGLIHESKPIPDAVYGKLGTASKGKVDKYYKVEMSRQDEVSIEEYF